jgi:hypothetical protein
VVVAAAIDFASYSVQRPVPATWSALPGRDGGRGGFGTEPSIDLAALQRDQNRLSFDPIQSLLCINFARDLG